MNSVCLDGKIKAQQKDNFWARIELRNTLWLIMSSIGAQIWAYIELLLSSGYRYNLKNSFRAPIKLRSSSRNFLAPCISSVKIPFRRSIIKFKYWIRMGRIELRKLSSYWAPITLSSCLIIYAHIQLLWCSSIGAQNQRERNTWAQYELTITTLSLYCVPSHIVS